MYGAHIEIKLIFASQPRFRPLTTIVTPGPHSWAPTPCTPSLRKLAAWTRFRGLTEADAIMQLYICRIHSFGGEE